MPGDRLGACCSGQNNMLWRRPTRLPRHPQIATALARSALQGVLAWARLDRAWDAGVAVQAMETTGMAWRGWAGQAAGGGTLV